jgi:hypothetical protein
LLRVPCLLLLLLELLLGTNLVLNSLFILNSVFTSESNVRLGLFIFNFPCKLGTVIFCDSLIESCPSESSAASMSASSKALLFLFKEFADTFTVLSLIDRISLGNLGPLFKSLLDTFGSFLLKSLLLDVILDSLE